MVPSRGIGLSSDGDHDHRRVPDHVPAMPRTGIRPLLFSGTALWRRFPLVSRIGPEATTGVPCSAQAYSSPLPLRGLYPLAAAGTMGVDRSEAGLASGLLNTARQVGGSLGLAVLATVASTHTHALERVGSLRDTRLPTGSLGHFSSLACSASRRSLLSASSLHDRGAPQPRPSQLVLRSRALRHLVRTSRRRSSWWVVSGPSAVG